MGPLHNDLTPFLYEFKSKLKDRGQDVKVEHVKPVFKTIRQPKNWITGMTQPFMGSTSTCSKNMDFKLRVRGLL